MIDIGLPSSCLGRHHRTSSTATPFHHGHSPPPSPSAPPPDRHSAVSRAAAAAACSTLTDTTPPLCWGCVPPSPPVRTVRSSCILVRAPYSSCCTYLHPPHLPPPHTRRYAGCHATAVLLYPHLASTVYRTTHASQSLSGTAHTSPVPCCFQWTPTSVTGCRATGNLPILAPPLPAYHEGRACQTPHLTHKLQWSTDVFVSHIPLFDYEPVL